MTRATATTTPQNNQFNEHALHVRFTCWYISLQSSAKQQREMIKTNGLWRTAEHDDKHFILFPNFNAVHFSFTLANSPVFYISKE